MVLLRMVGLLEGLTDGSELRRKLGEMLGPRLERRLGRVEGTSELFRVGLPVGNREVVALL